MANANKPKRLTPKQLSQLANIAETWGEVFEVYSCYGFLVTTGVVQRASAAQAEAHYRGLAVTLERYAGQIQLALAAGDYARVKELADHAAYVQEAIAGRGDDERNLATLSARGRELADKYLAQCARGVLAVTEGK